MRDAFSDRQNADSTSALVNHDQGTGRQVGLVLVESGDDRTLKVVGEDVLGADLEHARSVRVGQRQHGAEVQVVGEFARAQSMTS